MPLEREMRGKWCPHARVPQTSVVTDSRKPEPVSAVNRLRDGSLDARCGCVTVRCSQWIRFDDERGDCGLKRENPY